MPRIEYVHRSPEARVLLVSQRSIASVTWRCLLINFEDVIAAVDAVDIVAPMRPDLSRERLPDRATWRDRLRLGPRRAVSRLEPALGRRYPLLFVSLQCLEDLRRLDPLSDWVEAADVSVCYIEELWRSEVRQRRREIDRLRRFDLILLSCHGSVDEVAAATGRPCRYLPPAIDMLTFCPYPDPPARVIDIYAMGRRSAEMHRALMRVSSRRRLFYLYDTLSEAGVHDPADHRRHLAQLIKRSRYFLAMPAKFDVPGHTFTQHEVGFRFFEGAAAGAVLLGAAPDTPMFDQLFGWPDAVVPCTPDDVAAVLDTLERAPDRVDRIRRTNVINSLRRHDCAHRWSDVLAAAGLPATSGIEARLRRLGELIASAEQDTPGAVAGAADLSGAGPRVA